MTATLIEATGTFIGSIKSSTAYPISSKLSCRGHFIYVLNKPIEICWYDFLKINYEHARTRRNCIRDESTLCKQNILNKIDYRNVKSLYNGAKNQQLRIILIKQQNLQVRFNMQTLYPVI